MDVGWGWSPSFRYHTDQPVTRYHTIEDLNLRTSGLTKPRDAGDVNGGTLNDTWSFNTATHTWTKHSLPAGAVGPRGRNWANFWATHSGDVLWVQAGASVDYVPFGDMWR